MAFEPTDFEALVRYLDEHPDLRDQLRRRILSDDFLRLPTMVVDVLAALERLAEAQARTDETVERLVAAQARTDQRIDQLIAAQARTDAAIARLVAAQAKTDERIESLTSQVREHGIRLDQVSGMSLELLYRDRAPSVFGIALRRPRRIEVDELSALDDALADGRVSEREVAELHWLDLIVRGKDKREPGLPETLFAVEVSRTVDTEDVVRADQRAQILIKAGYRALGVVGGLDVTDRARSLAERLGVTIELSLRAF